MEMNEIKRYVQLLGIEFDDGADMDLFCETVIDCLEIRVWKKMSEKMSEKQLYEFEELINLNESKEKDQRIAAWIEKNCPSYREIIKDTEEAIREELKTYKNQIPGIKGKGL